jgi:hypothetical protein
MAADLTPHHGWRAVAGGVAPLPSGAVSSAGMGGDLTNPKLIYARGFLFLLAGGLAAAALLAEMPTVRTALLLALTVWCFARAYYFAFYVIQHYVDPGYRYAGLGSFARYLVSGRKHAPEAPTAPPPYPSDPHSL